MTEKSNKPIGWTIGVPPEVTTEYVGTKLGAYHTDREVMYYTQKQAREIIKEKFDIGAGGIRPDYSAYIEVSQLGGEIIFPEDNVPMVKEPVLREAKDVYHLKVIDPKKGGLMARALETFYWMVEREGGDIKRVGLSGWEGPVTSAVLVRGRDFYTDVFDHPKETHKLLEIVTDVSLDLRRLVAEVKGIKIEDTGIADDFSGLLSPKLYEEFCQPYHERIYREFGVRKRGMHSELLRRSHLRFVRELGITDFDPGCDQYLSVTDMAEELDGIPFWGNLKASQDVLLGTPQSIKEKVLEMVGLGAPKIKFSMCRGMKPENIISFVEFMRALERSEK